MRKMTTIIRKKSNKQTQTVLRSSACPQADNELEDNQTYHFSGKFTGGPGLVRILGF